MLPDRPLVRRRTALTGALGGFAATVLAAGCDTGDDLGENDATTSPSSTTSVAEEPEQSPDEALVDDVLARLGAAVAVLQAARRFKQLRPTVAPLLHAHRSHAEVLEGDLVGDLEGEAPASRPADQAAAAEAVRSSETQLQASLVDAAGRAESGALAKLLASMSASTTQHLATLSPPPRSGAPA